MVYVCVICVHMLACTKVREGYSLSEPTILFNSFETGSLNEPQERSPRVSQ